MQEPDGHVQHTASSQSASLSSTRPPLGHFRPPLVFPPSSQHRSTIIILHGRGSNAQKFAIPLLSSTVSGFGTRTFRDALPHTRFVFPTAPLMRATKYRRSVIHQWYDGTGDWEPEARGDMRPSIEYIHGLIRHEAGVLHAAAAAAASAAARTEPGPGEKDCSTGGREKDIVLAGISQGCAMALMSMLLWDGQALGAMVGMCGFMPLNAYLTGMLKGSKSKSAWRDEDDDLGDNCHTLDDGDTDDTNDDDDDDIIVFAAEGAEVEEEAATREDLSPLQRAIAELREEAELDDNESSGPSPLSFLTTPVFLGHGTEDQNVELSHGKQAAALLRLMGLDVQFREYRSLGHWYSADMLKHIVGFLASRVGFDERVGGNNE